ncbi:MAG: carbohydrate binding family 9 domain-containing protein, partial [Gemmatimonadota bacterium]
MLLSALFLLQLAVPSTQDVATRVFDGRGARLDVAARRIDTTVTIDGVLNESPWSRAAVLTGFSQFAPVDGRAATDSTEVLVWYSPSAMYFGIRAFAPAGSINAALSDRDKIQADDHVQILLSTFNDGRQAFVFAVNPLGIQADGTISEGQAATRGAGTLGSSGSARDPVDLSANFVFESKGRLTDYGYEVEVRIPFKSLRYQSRDVQDWGLNVVRQVQRLGAEDSWAPARRGAASFLAQGGRLTGLRDITRG